MKGQGLKKKSKFTNEEFRHNVLKGKQLDERLLLNGQMQLIDFAAELACRLDAHEEVIYGYLQGIEHVLLDGKKPECVSKDSPLEVILKDGRRLYAKVMPFGQAKRVSKANELIRRSGGFLASRWTQIIGVPHEHEGEAVVVYVDARQSTPQQKEQDLILDKLKVLAHLHTESRALLKDPFAARYFPAIKHRSAERVGTNYERVREMYGLGLQDGDAQKVRKAYSWAIKYMNALSSEMTVCDGDLHKDNYVEGMVIDQEGIGKGHPYWDVSTILFDTDDIDDQTRRNYFREYLKMCRAIENPEAEPITDEILEQEWAKFELIAKAFELPWRVARVMDHDHLKDLDYRTKQREKLIPIIMDYISRMFLG